MVKEKIERPCLTTVPLKGTRKLHSIRCRNGFLQYRNLTCSCHGCKQDINWEEGEYVEPWKAHIMFHPDSAQSSGIADGPGNESVLKELSTSTLDFLDAIDPDTSTHADNADDLPTLTDPPQVYRSHHPLELRPPSDNSPSPLSQTKPFNGSSSQDSVKDNDTPHLPGSSDNPLPRSPRSADKLKLQAGCWVLAMFAGKMKQTYLGMILATDDGEANVKFCRRNGQYFTWPAADDIGWMPTYTLTAIDPPSLAQRERMTLTEDVLALF